MDKSGYEFMAHLTEFDVSLFACHRCGASISEDGKYYNATENSYRFRAIHDKFHLNLERLDIRSRGPARYGS